ncbi:MAG TPA: hypothetical protein DIV47_02025 [Candidatus Pacebacteria bacterium]|nr:hypothetical protein [Candidatus Paceibacterota bacterium]
MSKKRTRAQKIKVATHRQRLTDRAENSRKIEQTSTPTLPTAFIPQDLVRALVATLIVLGVLLAVFVYTRMSF